MFVCVRAWACMCGSNLIFFSALKSARCSWQYEYIVRLNWPTISFMWSRAVKLDSIATAMHWFCSSFMILQMLIVASLKRYMVDRIRSQLSSPNQMVRMASEWKVALPLVANHQMPALHWLIIEGKNKITTFSQYLAWKFATTTKTILRNL